MRLLVAALVAAMGVGGATASACVPLPLVTVEPTSSAPPGTEIQLRGGWLEEGEVEVRWNASTGPVLATAKGPDFSAAVTVPKAPAGLYALVVLSRRADGSLNGNKVAVPFEVTAGPGTAGAAPAAGNARDNRSSSGGVRLGGAGAALVSVGLLAVGALAGAGLARRRRPSDPVPA